MFVWSTVVYNPIAEWTWNPKGWSFKLGVLDFAGGAPVHMSSGAAALAYSYALGKRTGFGTEKLNYRPHNITHIIIGTVFLWVGWFGYAHRWVEGLLEPRGRHVGPNLGRDHHSTPSLLCLRHMLTHLF